jgi:hypothetical protein
VPNFLCPKVLARTLSVPRQRKKGGPSWQYHSRSDHHSKVPCVLMALDFMLTSQVLCDAIKAGRVAVGINHVMVENSRNRKKAFDLVLHRADPRDVTPPQFTFKGLMKTYGIELMPDEQQLVSTLPDIPVKKVAAHAVYTAFEAKACMTEHGKARPRLFDELNSSHLTIHGDTIEAIAVGLVLINAAPTFISPGLNPDGPISPKRITHHKQPESYRSVISKIHELPMRRDRDEGFDELGIVVVECRNDGSPIALVDATAEVKGRDYDRMITRVAHRFESAFR